MPEEDNLNNIDEQNTVDSNLAPAPTVASESETIVTPVTLEQPRPADQLAPLTHTPIPASQTLSDRNKKKKKLTILESLAAGVAVLLGGTAAAYFAVVIPNKPENILKKAISNAVTQKKAKFEGIVNYENTDKIEKIKAVKVDFKGQSDADTNSFEMAVNATLSGATLPLEIRSTGKKMYFKIGDLGSIKGLAQAANPSYGSAVDAINKTIANQWIVADETLLKQAGADCMINTSFVLTKEDAEVLQKRYQEVPFANVKSHTADFINGSAAVKYEIDIDYNKGAEFAKGLNELSVVKKIKQCNSDKSDKSPAGSLVDNDTTTLTLWVDKSSKQVVKLAGRSTMRDEEKSKFKANYEITIRYGEASVTKPDGAKPFMEVVEGLSQLFSGLLMQSSWRANPVPSTFPGSVEGVSTECLRAIQAYSNSGGTTSLPASCM